jgi:hypothetical protein
MIFGDKRKPIIIYGNSILSKAILVKNIIYIILTKPEYDSCRFVGTYKPEEG